MLAWVEPINPLLFQWITEEANVTSMGSCMGLRQQIDKHGQVYADLEGSYEPLIHVRQLVFKERTGFYVLARHPGMHNTVLYKDTPGFAESEYFDTSVALFDAAHFCFTQPWGLP